MPLVICSASPHLPVTEQEVRVALAADSLDNAWDLSVVLLESKLIRKLTKLVIKLRELLLLCLEVELDVILTVMYFKLLWYQDVQGQAWEHVAALSSDKCQLVLSYAKLAIL